MNLSKKKEPLLDRLPVNNPECMRAYLDNHSIHTNGKRNTVTEDDVGNCIICTRLTEFKLSEIRASHPKYNRSKQLLRLENLPPPTYVVI